MGHACDYPRPAPVNNDSEHHKLHKETKRQRSVRAIIGGREQLPEGAERAEPEGGEEVRVGVPERFHVPVRALRIKLTAPNG